MLKYQFLGVFAGLFFAVHSLKTILHINLHYMILVFLLLTAFFIFIKDYLHTSIYIFKTNLTLFLLYIGLSFYAFLTYLLNIHAFIPLVEFILISLFFLIGKIMNTISLKYFYMTIISITFIQSVILIVDRGYIYDYGINYLLITLMIGISAVFVYILIFEKRNNILKKIILSIILIVYILALLNTQSRATFIFLGLFILIYPYVILNNTKRLTYFFVLALVFIFATSYLLTLYENSMLFNRMSRLYMGGLEDEPRLLLYDLFFHKMDGMWLTGFGIGQSSDAIFHNFQDKYPHNFILEFGSEFGVLGLAFILLFFVDTLIKLNIVKLKSVNVLFKFNMILFLYFIFIFFKSFSIYDSYALFFCFGLIWSTNYSIIKEKLANKYNYTNTQS